MYAWAAPTLDQHVKAIPVARWQWPTQGDKFKSESLVSVAIEAVSKATQPPSQESLRSTLGFKQQLGL